MNTSTQRAFSDLQTTDITIERNGITKTFRVRELKGDEASRTLNATKSNGKRDPEKAKTIDARLVATAVTEVVGETERPITFEEAQAMGLALRRRLVKEALDINGLGDDEDDEKN